MQCVFCQSPINKQEARSGALKLYCSEFCADSESETVIPISRELQKERMGRAYIERLKRLAVLRRVRAAR
jgi:hypothetical protein